MASSDLYELFFEWPSTAPSTVIVTGTFDQWSKSKHLNKTARGFVGTVKVPWNEKIKYKFIVDGQWLTLRGQPTELDPGGYINNVLTTPPKPGTAPNGTQPESTAEGKEGKSDTAAPSLPATTSRVPMVIVPVNSVEHNTVGSGSSTPPPDFVLPPSARATLTTPTVAPSSSQSTSEFKTVLSSPVEPEQQKQETSDTVIGAGTEEGTPRKPVDAEPPTAVADNEAKASPAPAPALDSAPPVEKTAEPEPEPTKVADVEAEPTKVADIEPQPEPVAPVAEVPAPAPTVDSPAEPTEKVAEEPKQEDVVPEASNPPSAVVAETTEPAPVAEETTKEDPAKEEAKKEEVKKEEPAKEEPKTNGTPANGTPTNGTPVSPSEGKAESKGAAALPTPPTTPSKKSFPPRSQSPSPSASSSKYGTSPRKKRHSIFGRFSLKNLFHHDHKDKDGEKEKEKTKSPKK